MTIFHVFKKKERGIEYMKKESETPRNGQNDLQKNKMKLLYMKTIIENF